ncbi:MAG: HDOD domain-containing protein [Gammaproteobacteria bacterium]|jgi:HD-like signal output (HDOD) protein|nr:HDOD domain-containing protein [Gammaproteobacteria bacterium]MBP6052984.1 HDOD domain-containing protein [Pseudomonadales bacterium]MBK6584004.1 HDOD domain-containing protein [Gammaproteobacteria bacterium]MBK7169284.1 HDOD domain-containing protein [Gammaproteobacteria bacterium]MBK7522509.1 HDOD domain-containing protein [Gammaproteobacteria bacterium]
MTTAHALVADIRELVSLPEAYLHIQGLMRDPHSSVEDFTRAVQNDPGLVARVLQVANSAFFGLSRKVETISLAINLMGISRLHDLVLATSVISTFNGLRVTEMDMTRFWRRSIHTGILARMLAEECGIFDSERLFVSGLLHDIGHLVMYLRIPQQALAAMVQSREQSRPLRAIEKELLGFDYCEVGAALMQAWRFPESLQEICRLHADPGSARQFPRETALVNLAQHVVASGDAQAHSLPFVAPLDAIALQLAGLGPQALAQVSAASQAPLAETLELLLPRRAA